MTKPEQNLPKVEIRLKAAAARAISEAEARRAAAGTSAGRMPALAPETGGREGPEPARYGDWEKKGLICDF